MAKLLSSIRFVKLGRTLQKQNKAELKLNISSKRISMQILYQVILISHVKQVLKLCLVPMLLLHFPSMLQKTVKSFPSHCAFFRIGRRPRISGNSRSTVLKVNLTLRGPVTSDLAILPQAVA